VAMMKVGEAEQIQRQTSGQKRKTTNLFRCGGTGVGASSAKFSGGFGRQPHQPGFSGTVTADG
jgi:hypothetical protein